MLTLRRISKACHMYVPLLIAASPAAAHNVELEGFASIVAGQLTSETKSTGFTSDPGTVLGYDKDLSFTTDSLFAVQLFSDLQQGLTATAQIVAKGEDNWKPEVVWGFLTYQLTDILRIKAGRIRAPFFLFSDTIDVGYSYPWINPPNDIYILQGIDNVDGINFELIHSFGDWISKTNLVMGNSFTSIRIAGRETDIEAKQVQNITWNLNRDWFTWQMSLAKTVATVDAYNELIGAFDTLAIPFTDDELDLLTLTEDDALFSGIGVYIDYHPWIFISELTTIKIDDAPMQHDRSAWYSTLGYHWNKTTYHITYIESNSPVAQKNIDLVNSKIVPVIEALPDDNPLVMQLQDTTTLAYLTDEETVSTGIGIRYEFHSSAAFKTELQHRHNKIADTHPTIFMMGIDMVF